MQNFRPLALALLGKILIPALAAFGGVIAAIYPAHLAAFCSGLN